MLPEDGQAIEKYRAQQLRDQRGDDNSENFLKEVNPDGDISDSDDDVDKLLEELDNDNDLQTKYREERLAQLKHEFAQIDKARDQAGSLFGKIDFVDDEKLLMDTVAKGGRCIVHFYHGKFSRCTAMNEALAGLAEKHVAVKVLAIEAPVASFLVAKLAIKVLPFVVAYDGGVECGRLVGFEGLQLPPGGTVTVSSLDLWARGVFSQ